MSERSREVEGVLLVSADDQEGAARRVGALERVDRFELRPRPTQRIRDVYLDTGDGDLAGARVACQSCGSHTSWWGWPSGCWPRLRPKVGHPGSGTSKRWTGKLDVMPPSENHSSWARTDPGGHDSGLSLPIGRMGRPRSSRTLVGGMSR